MFIKTYAAVLIVWVTILSTYSAEALLIALLLAISWMTSCFNLVWGGRYNLSLWPTTKSRAARTLKTAAMIFTCPVTLCTICPPLVFLAVILFPIGVSAFVVRLSKAEETWARAQWALDGNEEVSLWVPVPDPPDAKPADAGMRDTP